MCTPLKMDVYQCAQMCVNVHRCVSMCTDECQYAKTSVNMRGLVPMCTDVCLCGWMGANVRGSVPMYMGLIGTENSLDRFINMLDYSTITFSVLIIISTNSTAMCILWAHHG